MRQRDQPPATKEAPRIMSAPVLRRNIRVPFFAICSSAHLGEYSGKLQDRKQANKRLPVFSLKFETNGEAMIGMVERN